MTDYTLNFQNGVLEVNIPYCHPALARAIHDAIVDHEKRMDASLVRAVRHPSEKDKEALERVGAVLQMIHEKERVAIKLLVAPDFISARSGDCHFLGIPVEFLTGRLDRNRTDGLDRDFVVVDHLGRWHWEKQ